MINCGCTSEASIIENNWDPERVSTYCSSPGFGFGLNNVQLGLTHLLVCNQIKFSKKKQLLLLPSGYGKSRVIFGIIVCLALGKEDLSDTGQAFKEVEVVYNHEAQMLDEKPKLD